MLRKMPIEDSRNFEDGIYDARCQTVDPIAYEIYPEYRKGVEIAKELIASSNNALRHILNLSPNQRLISEA